MRQINKKKGSESFPFFLVRSTKKLTPTKTGAGNEARTRDLNLGKVALYQLSYSRVEGPQYSHVFLYAKPATSRQCLIADSSIGFAATTTDGGVTGGVTTAAVSSSTSA